MRKKRGAQNFAILHHIATNLLKQERTAKMGVKAKRWMAGWDEGYLLKLLSRLFAQDAIALGQAIGRVLKTGLQRRERRGGCREHCSLPPPSLFLTARVPRV